MFTRHFLSHQINTGPCTLQFLWVNNHFTDFELDSDMMELLDTFETRLEGAKMQGQLRMLNFACAAKARLSHQRPSPSHSRARPSWRRSQKIPDGGCDR